MRELRADLERADGAEQAEDDERADDGDDEERAGGVGVHDGLRQRPQVLRLLLVHLHSGVKRRERHA
eukprot:54938-Rhodomonas_salina.1